jgi:hypothetical protein
MLDFWGEAQDEHVVIPKEDGTHHRSADHPTTSHGTVRQDYPLGERCFRRLGVRVIIQDAFAVPSTCNRIAFA